MKRPGAFIRAVALHLCDEPTIERIIDPLIADLQHEHAHAVSRSHPWRARWIHAAGVIRFLHVLALCAARTPRRRAGPSAARGDTVVPRLIGYSVALIGVITAALVLDPLLRHGARIPSGVALYLVPQALALGLPAGVFLGVAMSGGGRTRSRRVHRSLAVVLVAASLFELTIVGWVTPAANDAFRHALARRVIAKGVNELTLPELRNRASADRADGRARDAAMAGIAYQERLALAASPVVLGVFGLALGLSLFRRWPRMLIALAALTAYLFTASLMRTAALSSRADWPIWAVWAPNVWVAVVALGFLAAARRAVRRVAPTPN
jgi:lipopolysaccharide export system permease LptF/LptG-like protein